MSRKGNCCDNAPMECVFKTLKVERVYQTPVKAERSPVAAQCGVRGNDAGSIHQPNLLIKMRLGWGHLRQLGQKGGALLKTPPDQSLCRQILILAKFCQDD